jgi:hypothetical protein
MSYIAGPGPGPEAEVERARVQEPEAKAERYAATHPDDGGSNGSPSLLQRIIGLFRRPGH